LGGSSNLFIANGGTVDATGRADQTLALARGQTLQGNGAVNGSLSAGFGSIVTPGADATTIGSLSVSSSVTLGGNTVMKIDPVAAACDTISASNVTYSGTLILTNITPAPLAPGSSYRLFNAAHFAGTVASIIPARPGPSLAWDIGNLAVTGYIAVEGVPRPDISSFTQLGASLSFHATNGVSSASYTLLASTNLLAPLAQWTPLFTTTPGASGNFTFTTTNPGVPQMFYILRGQ
jgi:hypothetical protein